MGISLVKGMDIEMGKDWRTGLYTLKTFKQIVPALFEHPEKLKYAAVLFIDADGLTYINETYGIDKGNVYLQGIAKCFYQCSAPMKIGTRRFDGDEFIFFSMGVKAVRSWKRILKKSYRSSREAMSNLEKICILN